MFSYLGVSANWGSCFGGLFNKSPTIYGLYKGPLILAHSHLSIKLIALVDFSGPAEHGATSNMAGAWCVWSWLPQESCQRGTH